MVNAVWTNANLAAALPDAAAKATAAVDTASKAIAALQGQIDALTQQMNGAVSALSVNKSDLVKVTSGGVYMITLAPKLGSWAGRLAAALGEPSGGGFCCGTANIILSADPQKALDGYAKTKELMKKPVADAGSFFKNIDLSDFIPDTGDSEQLADLDESQYAAPEWDTLFTSDEWKSATVGDIFGGAMAGIAGGTNVVAGMARDLLDSINQKKKQLATLQKGMASAGQLLDDLGKTGAYTVILEPGWGNYLTRLTSAVGAPTTDSNLYSAGFVCIAVEPDLTAVAAKFATLKKMAGGI